MKNIDTGKYIYVYGHVGNLGTSIIIDNFDFKNYYSKLFLDKYKKNIDEEINTNKKNIKNISRYFNSSEVEEITKGGIYKTLWDMSKTYNYGMDFSQKEIPVHQITLEICNFFEISPYRLLTSGAYLIFESFKWYEDFIKENGKDNIACIGRLYNKKECARIDGDTKAYLTKDSKDEIDKVIKNYTKKK